MRPDYWNMALTGRKDGQGRAILSSVEQAVESPGTDVIEDTELVQRARDNDYKAYEQLYHRHVGRVFAVCYRLCNDRDTAEDLTQEAFVQAWRKLGGFRGDSAFGSWLYRIATNTTLSYFRKQKHFLGAFDIEDVPEQEYRETNDEQITLEDAIATLPDGARTVFVLYSVEGYTHEEIASLVGIAVGSSKAQLHRARSLLKQQLSL